MPALPRGSRNRRAAPGPPYSSRSCAAGAGSTPARPATTAGSGPGPLLERGARFGARGSLEIEAYVTDPVAEAPHRHARHEPRDGTARRSVARGLWSVLSVRRPAHGGRRDPAGHRPARQRDRRRRIASRPAGTRSRADDGRPVAHRGDDPLLAMPPEVYVRRLLGVDVPRHRKVPCPFHEDRHASLHVYATAERGWYCFRACRRGGTIYDLAAPLYGYTARGQDFLRLRSELRRLFGLEAA